MTGYKYVEHFGEDFDGETVILDGGHWDRCTFTDCRVEFHEKAPVLMGSNSWNRCVLAGNFPAGWVAAAERGATTIREDGREHLQ